MREALFILIVIAVLFGLTLIRYRKQIAGMIGLARTLKELREQGGSPPSSVKGPAQPANLVHCSKCGVWVPEGRAVRSKSVYFCSESCLKSHAVT